MNAKQIEQLTAIETDINARGVDAIGLERNAVFMLGTAVALLREADAERAKTKPAAPAAPTVADRKVKV